MSLPVHVLFSQSSFPASVVCPSVQQSASHSPSCISVGFSVGFPAHAYGYKWQSQWLLALFRQVFQPIRNPTAMYCRRTQQQTQNGDMQSRGAYFLERRDKLDSSLYLSWKEFFNKEGIRFAVVMCHQEVPSLFTRFFNIWPIRKGSVNILVWLLLFFQLLVFAKQNEVLSCSLCRHIRLKLLRIDAECHVRKGHKLTSKSLLPQQFCRMVVASTNSKMMVLVHLINILGKDVVRLIVHGLW